MNPFFGHAQLPEYVPQVPASSHNLAGWRPALTDTHGYEPVRTQRQAPHIAYQQPPKAPRVPQPPPTKPYVPRIAKACVECRRSKRQCSGGVLCKRCETQHLSCVYTNRKAEKKAKTEQSKKLVVKKQRGHSSSSASSSKLGANVSAQGWAAPFDFGTYGNDFGFLSAGSLFSGIPSSSGPSSASSPAFFDPSSSDLGSLNSRRSSMASADSSFYDLGFPASRRPSMAGPARTSRRSSRAHPYSSAAPTIAQPQYAFDIDATIDELFPSGLGSFSVPSSNAGNPSLPSTDLFAELDPYRVPSQY